MDVPDSRLYCTIRLSNGRPVADDAGVQAASMFSPGAVISGCIHNTPTIYSHNSLCLRHDVNMHESAITQKKETNSSIVKVSTMFETGVPSTHLLEGWMGLVMRKMPLSVLVLCQEW